MRAVHTAVGLLALACSLGAADAKEIYERPWVEVRSPHFVMTSALDPDTSAAIVRNLERLREAAQIMTGRRVSEHIPTNVYFFTDYVDALALDKDHDLRFTYGLRSADLVVGKLDPRYLDYFYDLYL